MPATCLVCHKPIVDNAWFCRLPKRTDGSAGSQTREILLCSPVCALRHLGDSQPGGNGFEPNYDGYENSPRVPEDQKTAEGNSTPKSRTKQ